MKPITLALLLGLFANLHTFAQADFYADYGLPSSQEIDLKKCSFDPEAEAVYLHKDAKVLPDNYRMFTYSRVRMKILKESGIKHASVRIRYLHQDDFEYITDIKGVVINKNPDGSLKTSYLAPKEIYRKKIDGQFSFVTFTFPEVHEGSIIEYVYTRVRKSYRMIDYWYFQDDLPVYNSFFHFTILPVATFNYRVLKSERYNCDVVPDQREGAISFEMKNIPGLPDEPYMDSRNDYLQRVELQLAMVRDGSYNNRFISSWEEATGELLQNENFGRAVERRISGTEDLIKQASAIQDENQRMSTIYYSVKKKMNWDGYQGFYGDEKLKTKWATGQGDAGDINLILINILKASGLNVVPMLVSERSHGRVDINAPFLSQFNKVIAYVKINNKEFFLDATDELDNTVLIPIELLNTTGFPVFKKNKSFVQIADKQNYEKRTISLRSKITPQGIMEGEASITESGYARAYSELRIRSDREGFVKASYIKPYSNLAVDSFKIENLEKDTLPLNQTVKFKQQLGRAGDYTTVSINLFAGFNTNPFVSKNRFTDVNFGCRKTVVYFQNIELPDNFIVESLPKNASLTTADKDIFFTRSMEVSKDNKRITMYMKIDFQNSLYTASEYQVLHEFYKKMQALLDEPVLLKNK
jgi:hypothetical protein